MFKRIIWMGTGMAVGAGSAFWAKRKVETTVERYLPEQVADRAAATARGLGQTVRAAAVEGREAMRERERELRSQVEARTFTGTGRPVGTPPTRAEPTGGAGARRAGRVAAPRAASPGSRRKPRR